MPTRLITARMNRGLSLRAAAEAIDIDRRTLQRAEQGQSIHPGSAHAIASFYGYQVTDIWDVDASGTLTPRRVAA